MTNADLTFIVVEDKIVDRTEVLNELAKARFDPAKRLGTAATYEDAKELLERHATSLDVVFLDLNIPRNENDSRPEDKHGMLLLDFIHLDLNKRPGVDIRVIIISGQDLASNEASKKLMLDHYSTTLVGVTQKAAMVEMLRANLRRLRRDPVLASLRRLHIDLIPQWETLTDTSKAPLNRLSAGRAIAIRIAQNELDYREGREHSHPEFEDNLAGLYWHLMKRFNKREEAQRVSTGDINSLGGWGCFVWRGILMEHFRSINNYWNAYKHLGDRPYNNPTESPEEWHVPDELVNLGNRGEVVVKIVELAVRDLLDWYIPWHEQVLKTEIQQ